MTRVLLLDATYGWMVEQHFYDANGQLLLSARASQHRFYPEDAVTMPHHVELRLLPGQPSQLAFDVDVSRYVFNRLTGAPSELWTLPQIAGYPRVDIADPRFRPPLAAVTPGSHETGGKRRPPSYEALSRGAVVPPVPVGRYGTSPSAVESRSVYGQPHTATLPVYRGYR